MIKQSVAKRLIKNYNRIDSYNRHIKMALNNDCYSIRKLEKNNLLFEERKLKRLLNYIEIYKTVFHTSLEKLDDYEISVIKEYYLKGKMIHKISQENFISEVTVYRIFKKFEYYFALNIMKTKRIINHLLPLCKETRRRI